VASLTPQQLARLASDAGFRGDAVKWAVAIALAESGGNPSAYNPELAAGTQPNAGSRGLWQIYGTAHPQYNSSIAFDPNVNAQAAYQVFREAGGRFTPWSTFNNGMAASIYRGLNISAPSGGRTRKKTSNAGTTTTTTTRTTAQRLTQENMTGLQGTGDPNAAPLKQAAQALGDIASGAWFTNIIKDFDPVSFSFYVMGSVLIVIGLIVIFKNQVGNAALGAVELAAASKGIPLKLNKL
jgi:hypothetical protein